MIHESSPVTNAFVSVPADMGQLNCAAFLAGIIAGVLDSARFVSHILYSIMSIQQASCNLVKLSFVKDPDRGPWTVRPTGQSSIVFLSTFVRSHIFKYWWDVDERDLIMCLFPLFTFPLPSLHLPFSPSSFSPLLSLYFVLSTFFFDFSLLVLLTHLYYYFLSASACPSHRSYCDSQGGYPGKPKLWQDSIPCQILCRSNGKREKNGLSFDKPYIPHYGHIINHEHGAWGAYHGVDIFTFNEILNQCITLWSSQYCYAVHSVIPFAVYPTYMGVINKND